MEGFPEPKRKGVGMSFQVSLALFITLVCKMRYPVLSIHQYPHICFKIPVETSIPSCHLRRISKAVWLLNLLYLSAFQTCMWMWINWKSWEDATSEGYPESLHFSQALRGRLCSWCTDTLIQLQDINYFINFARNEESFVKMDWL